jgi:hypothetical protein
MSDRFWLSLHASIFDWCENVVRSRTTLHHDPPPFPLHLVTWTCITVEAITPSRVSHAGCHSEASLAVMPHLRLAVVETINCLEVLPTTAVVSLEDRSRFRRLTVWTTTNTVRATPVTACQRIFVGWPAIQSQKPETTMAAVRRVRTRSERANLPGRFYRWPTLASRRTRPRDVRRRCQRCAPTSATKPVPPQCG